MLEFVTQPILIGAERAQLPCLVHYEAGEDDEAVLRDGQRVTLPAFAIQAIARTARLAQQHEAEGAAVDCHVFATLAMGGGYRPVDEETYRSMHHRSGSGSLLSTPEAEEAAPHMRMVQFGIGEGGNVRSKHAAVQLPEQPNLYVQKLGFRMPIALASAEQIAHYYRCNAVLEVTHIEDRLDDGQVVLSYHSSAQIQE